MSANFITVLPIYNQDYPADLLRPRFSSIPAGSITLNIASDTPFPIHILYRYGLSKAAFNQKGVKLKLKYDLSVNNSYVSIKY